MSLHITSTSKATKVQPKTKDELKSIIKQELKCQGPNADLNFIDTSLITDMCALFMRLYIRNIKIDKWDVSNVTDMSGMFSGCKKFDCDLSGWDISNVVYNNYMFDGCDNCAVEHRPQVSHRTCLIHSMYELSKRYNNANKYSVNTIITNSATYDLFEELKNYVG